MLNESNYVLILKTELKNLICIEECMYSLIESQIII